MTAIRIEEKFDIDAPPPAVWAFLSDPSRVALCLPGAEITGRQDNGDYTGRVTVKVGPITVAYKGTIHFERLDGARMEAELIGRGQDVKGKGGAEMRMTSRVFALEGGGSQVTITSDVAIKGVLAQMGRGMIEAVGGQIFREFVAAVRIALAAQRETAPAATTPLSAASLVGALAAGTLGRVARWLRGSAGRSSHGR